MNLHNDAVLANIMVKLCKGAFLAGVIYSQRRHYITGALKGRKR